LAKRFNGGKFDVTFHPERLDAPMKLRKPARIFVNSMGDLFHNDVPVGLINQIANVMERCDQHVFIILTKRPERMKDVCHNIISNVWLGVTAENQARADERIPILLSIPAAVHFVSVEPMLGPVSLTRIKIARQYYPPQAIRPIGEIVEINALTGNTVDHLGIERTGGPKLDWVIAGPETGPGARECRPTWITTLWDECFKNKIPFFDKREGYLAREWPDTKARNEITNKGDK
jgi:protein gp37